MQFIGQTHILRVNISNAKPDIEFLQNKFEEIYLDRFKVELSEIKANIVNINTTVQGHRDPLDISFLNDVNDKADNLVDALLDEREVFFEDKMIITPIYSRDKMPFNFSLKGPAIIEQMDTTTLVEPDDLAYGDDYGNIFIKVGNNR